MSAATVAHPGAGHAVGRTNEFTGTGTLIRFMLRRDRVRIAVWLAALTLGSMATANSFSQLYPTPADRAGTAQTMGTPAGLAMTGPPGYLDDYNLGAMLGHQMIGFMGIIVGLMSVLMVTRHTRAEEEAGRAELVRAGILGRHAQLAATLALVIGVNLALALLLTAGLGGLGMAGVTWGGSLLYGMAHAAMGIVFAAVAAVTVQISEHTRATSGMALAVIGLAYALRAAGDVGNGVASWFSPIGWAQRTFAYVDNRWWPLLLSLGATVLLVGIAAKLSTRRDVGIGLRAPRAGAAAASAGLLRPVGFAFRLHRGLLLGFSVGMFLVGVMFGSILDQVENMLASVDAAQEMLARMGGASVTESFLSVIMLFCAPIAAIYVVLAVTRMRTEETAGRAEPVLATALSRTRWAISHVVVGLIGSVVVLLATGLGLGLTGAGVLSDAGMIGTGLGTALAYLPAVWLTGGVAIALFGWLPRAVGLAWIIVGYGFIVGYLGNLLQFPGWMGDISPFGQVPRIPAADFSATPIVVLTVIAAALVAVGLAGFRNRNLEAV